MVLGDISYSLGLNIGGFEKNAVTADAILTRLNLKLDATIAKLAAAGEVMNRFGTHVSRSQGPVREMTQTFEQLELPLQESTRLLEDMSLPLLDVAGHFEQMGKSAGGTSDPVKKSGDSLKFMGDATFSLIGLLSPLILVLGILGGALAGVTAILLVFTTALVGFLSTLALAFGAIALVGAGVVALGVASSGGLNAAANLTKAQQQVAAATTAHNNAVIALQRAQLAGGPTHTFTATQLVTLHQAQANAAKTATDLTTAQKNLTAAQLANQQPLAILVQNIKAMGESLGKEAVPFVNQLAAALIPAVPQVQAFGSGLIQWFGGKLPEMMRIAADAIQPLRDGFNALGTAINFVVDDTLNHMPEFEGITSIVFRQVIEAIIGLIGNLHNLSDWFIINLPVYGPIVGQIFSQIGTIVQGMSAQVLRFADWTVANWPSVVQVFQTTADVLQKVGDAVGFLTDHLNVVLPILGILVTVWSAWNVVVGISNAVIAINTGLHAIGNAAKITAAAVTGIGTAAQWLFFMAVAATNAVLGLALFQIIGHTIARGALAAVTGVVTVATTVWAGAQWLLNAALFANPIGLVILAIVALIVIIVLVVTHWNQVIATLSRVWSWLQQVLNSHIWLQVVLTVILGPIVLLIAHWNQVIGVLGSVATWVGHIGDAFSWLGSVANGLAQTIGGAFSVFGKAVHDALWQIAHAIDTFDASIDRLPGLSGFLPTNLEAFAGGGKVARAAIVGEDGSGYPEYVIPTNPMHRSNAIALTAGLLGDLSMMAGGGVIGSLTDPILNAAHAAMGLAGSMGGLGIAIVDRLMTTITDKLGSIFANFGAGTGLGANVMQWIMQAILLTGVPASWASGLATIISRESGGNPNAINNWDINALRGDPSRGLMQTIGGTFNAYHWPGTSWDIFDPVANIAAGINYILHRYGSIENVQQANPNLPPMGYDNGGVLPPGLTLAYNGTGQGELVVPGGADRLANIEQHLATLAGRGGIRDVHFHGALPDDPQEQIRRMDWYAKTGRY